MWVIFRDPKTPFNHIDKFVVDVIADEDILAYQKQMQDVVGGRSHEIHEDVYFLQNFFSSDKDIVYFARKYKSWTDHASS